MRELADEAERIRELEKFYTVALSYEYSTVMVSVHALDEHVAEEKAIEILVGEWGPGIRDYMDCTIY